MSGWTAGASKPTKMAMLAMATSNSMSVNPVQRSEGARETDFSELSG